MPKWFLKVTLECSTLSLLGNTLSHSAVSVSLFIFSSFVCCAAEAVSVADCAAGVAAPCAAALFSFSGQHAIRVHAETTASAAFKNLDFMIYLLIKIST